jgi:predicted nucleic acid-binding protein
VRFFDASALVKRYIRESGSARVRRLLRDDAVAVSRLSEGEVVSALVRLSREDAISPRQRDRAASAFVADLAAWTIVELTPDVTRFARELLARYVLRAGDAVQLGAALLLQQALGQPLHEFVAHDARLLAAARAEQLVVFPR